ncbi:DUF4181 domain-containing protein [Oceanobacillus saliphilus]|uniref:DUF4181 domain-containing protein n=1 Tax=Oceanobacillus saliphilus TaxID=2925834 RepID=UPI00201E3CF1|nr:DUF4181 domain-containing protein [Oceanobacillus saliphilus]
MYNFEPLFWLQLAIFLSIFLLVVVTFDYVMRKLLKVEKKKLFSYKPVNEQHKKMEWNVRITFLILLVIGYLVNIMRVPMERIWFLEVWFITFLFIVVIESVRAMMEWKYAENRNAYILTIIQLVFIVLLLVIIYSTGFFGWF